MLAKKYKLSREKDIQYVLKKGKIYFSRFFNLKLAKNNMNKPRFCIIISTSISKKAVVRNRVKRQIRAIIYNNLPNIKENYDFIVLIKPIAVLATFEELQKTMTFLLKKAKIV